MALTRRQTAFGLAAALMAPRLARARTDAGDPAGVLHDWYRLVLELVRHTATYSPPVASRAFAYLGILAWEAQAATGRRSLAGQLRDMPAMPAVAGLAPGVVLHAALARGVAQLFANTGPTGQRATATMTRRLGDRAAAGVSPGLAADSVAAGGAVADAVLAWAATDGGASVRNMGFPDAWPRDGAPGQWLPTSAVRQQQAPLLPDWGSNRPFALPEAAACDIGPPPAYSEAPGSAFHAEAMEVYEVSRALTDEQKRIARFWSDDPMLSPTPPGHWVSIAMQCLEAQAAPADRRAEVLARLGIAVADAFIACWRSKYAYDLIRPVTYIRKVIDPKWEPLLITPPFPEYPSGHSTQSGAAAVVMEACFPGHGPFADATHADDGMPARTYPSFTAAAREAALSRLYGGIHFRAAIEQGLAQGACVGAHAMTPVMRA